jgi:5-methyltetrahydrofolate--homocysteine methyltransferase
MREPDQKSEAAGVPIAAGGSNAQGERTAGPNAPAEESKRGGDDGIDYARMNQLLFEGQHAPVKEMTEQALAAGRPAMEVLEDGLIAGMRVVGEDFRHNRVFVPEVLLAARAMKAGMAVLKPLLVERKDGEQRADFPVIVMGTVKGDLHDIGKNLVGMMAEGAGFTLVDLGTDTSAERFIDAVRQHGASLVGMSVLLTTTMVYMRTVFMGLMDAGLDNLMLCVGGAPVSAIFAMESGADGYAADAASAVALFKRLLGLDAAAAAGAASAEAAAAAAAEIAASDSSVVTAAEPS